MAQDIFSAENRLGGGGEQGDQFFYVAYSLEMENAILDLRCARRVNDIVG